MKNVLKQPKKQFSADLMMSSVASSLVRDFQSNLDDPLFCSDLQLKLQAGDLKGVREVCNAPIEEMDVARFKAAYQLKSVLKRYRYQTDIYSDSELEEKAIASFLETQDRIRSVDFDAVDVLTAEVIELARIYIADTIGVYSDEEHRSLCRFGRRASVGIPAKLACEAARWELPISGSQAQIAWFDSEMSQIESVQKYWQAQRDSDPLRSTYQEVGALALTLVPKTFKSLRAIMPNTTIGSYMSYGLGEMLRKRLKRRGYDLRTLQQGHRVLARSASVHGLCTTADLSSASDSISVALVEKLFPPDWVEILTQSRIGVVTLPNNLTVQSDTFCTMGIGYTFPLQTLVFLSLLKAIEAILNNRRINRKTISVYGDDLIYPSSMHSVVVAVFQQIGFVINLDKTFHEGNFRESCGGDYYHGVDVRPFQPRNGAATVGAKTYEAMLYKFINGLLMRWSEHEIGRTLAYLTSQVELVTGKVKRVPVDFPDDSGVKCPTLRHWDFLSGVALAGLKQLGHGLYRFSYLRLVSDDRKEERHEPYLWARMRGMDSNCHYDSWSSHSGCCQNHLQSVINSLTGVTDIEPALVTKVLVPKQLIRSNLTGRRLRRTATFVTVSHTGRYMRRSGTSCFEDRR